MVIIKTFFELFYILLIEKITSQNNNDNISHICSFVGKNNKINAIFLK